MTSGDGRAAALNEEREFFLRSLRDLDAERAAGDIDEVDYRALRDDYTARAAATIRQLEALADGGGGTDEATPAPPEQHPTDAAAPARRPRRRRPWTRAQKALVVAIVALLGATAGWVVSHRGGSSSAPRSGRLDAAQLSALLRQAAATAPRDPVAALGDYRRILAAYPQQPQALTEEGWLLAQGGELGAADADLRLAEQVDPSWDLPHGYRGIVLFGEDDYSGAVFELSYYLAHGPDPGLAGQARSALAAAQRDLAATAKG